MHYTETENVEDLYLPSGKKRSFLQCLRPSQCEIQSCTQHLRPMIRARVMTSQLQNLKIRYILCRLLRKDIDINRNTMH